MFEAASVFHSPLAIASLGQAVGLMLWNLKMVTFPEVELSCPVTLVVKYFDVHQLRMIKIPQTCEQNTISAVYIQAMASSSS